MILLRRLRQLQGLSQEALGEMVNISTSTISKMENGFVPTNIGTLAKMANVLGYGGDPADLVHEDLEIRYKLFPGGRAPLQLEVGDWNDLYTSMDVFLPAGKVVYIPLGIAMQLPKGYEAIMAPRSSTCKRWGVLQANSLGVIDESFCGDDDEWKFPAVAIKDVEIPEGTRLCQFRLIEHQPHISFREYARLGNSNRGGRGSTGA